MTDIWKELLNIRAVKELTSLAQAVMSSSTLEVLTDRLDNSLEAASGRRHSASMVPKPNGTSNSESLQK